MFPHQSGLVYPGPTTSNPGSSGTAIDNRLYLMPFYVPNSGPYDQLIFEQTAAGTPTYDVGIYGPITGAYAGAPLITSSGPFVSGGASLKVTSISVTLAAGWYLMALVSTPGSTIRRFATTQLEVQFGFTAVANPAIQNGLELAGVGVPLPSTVPAGAAPFSDNKNPYIALRRA
jgi:hypothetical protein